MDLSANYTFDAPRQRVWDLLVDPKIIANCLPGCESLEPTGIDSFEAKLTVNLAAITGRFVGTVQMTDKSMPSRYTLKVEGRGTPGFVDGSANISLTDTENNGTTVCVSGTANFGGTIARVGQRLLSSVSKMMIDRFFSCLQQAISSPIKE